MTALAEAATGFAVEIDGHRITVSIERVTPKMAMDLLASNTHNRHMKDRKVLQFAQTMRDGAWMFNGDAIRVAADGTLLDGQNRLEAIAKSGQAQWTLLVTGLPSEAQETMDQGTKRTFADTLTLRSEGNAKQLAAALRVLWFVELNGGSFASFAGRLEPGPYRLLQFLESHPTLRDCVQPGRGFANDTLLSPATAIALLYRLRVETNHRDADAFYAKVRDRARPNRAEPHLRAPPSDPEGGQEGQQGSPHPDVARRGHDQGLQRVAGRSRRVGALLALRRRAARRFPVNPAPPRRHGVSQWSARRAE
jgi:hypothetical protein